jgi:hypothetical protein
LAPRDRLDDVRLDLALPRIDFSIKADHRLSQFEITLRQRRDCALHRFFGSIAHIDDFRPDPRQVGVKGGHGMVRHDVYSISRRAWMAFWSGGWRIEKRLRIDGVGLCKTANKPPKWEAGVQAGILGPCVTHTYYANATLEFIRIVIS